MRLLHLRALLVCSLALSSACIDNPLDLEDQAEPRGTLVALQVAAGMSRTCALREDREITCWGARDFDGELHPPAGPFEDFAYNDTVGCARKADGQLACWGDLGTYDQPPVDIRLKRVVAGSGHMCGIDLEGRLRCWGGNSGTAPALSEETDYVDVAAGNGLSCGLRESGTVLCWTRQDDFQTPSTARFTSVVCGAYHACGLQLDGTALCWGENEHGQLNVPNARFSALAAGYGFTCGLLREDGRVLCWGERPKVMGRTRVQVPMEAPSGLHFRQLAAGVFHACAIDSARRVSCWGDDFYGNLQVP